MDKRKIVGIILMLFVLTLVVLMYVNKDEWFQQKIVIQKGNCEETYINGKLITDSCPDIEFNDCWDIPQFDLGDIDGNS